MRSCSSQSGTTIKGSGSSITLSLVNASGLLRLQYAWGIGSGGTTTVKIRNDATGLAIDGLGRTSGANAGQSTAGSSTTQQWTIQNDGNYIRIKNNSTGLYLDGMGRTTNGAAVGQYTDTNSTNQQWTAVSDGNTVLIQNRATGMYLDGMGRTADGSDLGQYSYSNSTNQQWQITSAG